MNLIKIQMAARILGVTTDTLRRWEEEGRLLPDSRTLGGWRLYDKKKLEELIKNRKP